MDYRFGQTLAQISFKNMAKDDTELGMLSSITRGASLFFIGRVVRDVFGFLFQIVLTRGLGIGLYGLYAYGKTLLLIFLVFTNLGSDTSLLKYLPQYDDDPLKQRFVLTLALGTSVAGSLVAAVILYIFSPVMSSLTLDDPRFVGVLRLFALILVFDTVAKILHSTFRGLERLKYEVISNKIIRPALRLGAAGFALILGFSIVGVMVALIIASALTLAIALYFLLTRFELRPLAASEQITRNSVFEYYNFSIPLTLKEAGDVLMRRIDVLMVGFFLSSTAVGVYNISVLLAGMLLIPLSAFNQLFPPIASRLYSEGKIEEINSLYSTVTRWILTISLIMGIGAITYRRELMMLFGEEFTAGTIVLVLFVIAQLFNCTGGANGYLLMMTNHQYVLVLNQWSFGVLNIVLNYVLILEFGLIGAALASAGVLAALNVVKTIELWYLEGLFPYSRTFVKPILASVFAAITMELSGAVLDGIPLLLLGGPIGVVTYAGLIVLFGIKEEDKNLFRKIVLKRLSTE